QIRVQLLGLKPGLCWIELLVHAPHLSCSLHIHPSSTLNARAEGGADDHLAGRDGRSSTRLTMVRAGIRNTMDTASATSSGAIIQLVSAGPGFSRSAGEFGIDAAWHDGTDAHVVVAMIQHQCLGETVKTKFCRVIAGASAEGVARGEAGDVNHESAAADGKAGQ